jgi:hypothetical protein
MPAALNLGAVFDREGSWAFMTTHRRASNECHILFQPFWRLLYFNTILFAAHEIAK